MLMLQSEYNFVSRKREKKTKNVQASTYYGLLLQSDRPYIRIFIITCNKESCIYTIKAFP